MWWCFSHNASSSVAERHRAADGCKWACAQWAAWVYRGKAHTAT
jgi:hypothetical protein